ncbi:MAG: hypothetical protein HY747_06280 [Elusimicrobia bacterium]|nr:hypothetical protein [Elusimicrobiota bacterium]
MSEAKESEFRGKPLLVLTLTPEDKYPFQFGLRKAKLILEHLEDIKKFVEKYGGEQPKNVPPAAGGPS